MMYGVPSGQICTVAASYIAKTPRLVWAKVLPRMALSMQQAAAPFVAAWDGRCLLMSHGMARTTLHNYSVSIAPQQ
jgi:hypothetical protein